MVKRKNELSFMNIVMCMLVIFIHIASWTLGSADRASLQYAALLIPSRLSAFVVQGFLFLAGVKFFCTDKPFSYGRFLSRRLTKIVVPYLLWVGIYYAYFIGIGWYKFSWEDLFTYVFLGTLCSHFYYIIITVQFYLLMPLWRWLVSRLPWWILCIGSLLITLYVKLFVHFPYDDRVFFAYLCYFICGAVVGRNYERVKAAVKKYAAAIFGAFLALAVLDGYFSYNSQAYGVHYQYFEALHLLYCFAAIFTLLAAGLFIFENRNMPRLLALVDRSSYGMYLSHVLFIYIANALLHLCGITDLAVTLLGRGAFTYLCTVVLSCAYTCIKEKIRK